MGAGRARSRGVGGDRNIGANDEFGYSQYALSDEDYNAVKDLEESLYQGAIDQDTFDVAIQSLRDAGVLVDVSGLPFKPNGEKEVIDQTEMKPKKAATVQKHLDNVFGDLLEDDSKTFIQKLREYNKRLRRIEDYVLYNEGPKPSREEINFYNYVMKDLSIKGQGAVIRDYFEGKPVGTSLPELLTGRKQVSHIEVIDNSAYNTTVRANATVSAQFMGTLIRSLNGYDKDIPLKLGKVSLGGKEKNELGLYTGMSAVASPDGDVTVLGSTIKLSGVLTVSNTGKNSGFHSTVDRSRSVASHEFGHYLQDVISTVGANGGLPSSVTSSNRFKFFTASDTAMRYDNGSNPLRATLTQGVSGYAQKNYREAFAEATSAYIMGVTPTQGKEYYREFKTFMSEVGLAHLEGLGRK